MSIPHYEPGTVRWRKHDDKDDVRTHRMPGWKVEAMQLDEHPITGSSFLHTQWWFKETRCDSD